MVTVSMQGGFCPPVYLSSSEIAQEGRKATG